MLLLAYGDPDSESLAVSRTGLKGVAFVPGIQQIGESQAPPREGAVIIPEPPTTRGRCDHGQLVQPNL